MSMSAATPTSAGPPARQGIGALVLTVLFLVVAGLLFFAIYLALPQNHEFGALLLIGSLSLVFAIGCYLSESISRDPSAQRSLAWAFLAMGFATLFLSVGLGPSYGVESFFGMLIGLIFLVILLAITIALIVWRTRAVETTARREVARKVWQTEAPVSALSYSTANSPSMPTSTPPPASGNNLPPSGGA
jgi:Zn-dependent protease with chaperone function